MSSRTNSSPVHRYSFRPNSFLHLYEKIWNASENFLSLKRDFFICFLIEKFIIVICIAYAVRLFIQYLQLALSSYVFLTKNELKQLGFNVPGRCELFDDHWERGGKEKNLICLETGFVVCDDPQLAETAYNRHKYFNRLLCWISPQTLHTNILNQQKNPSSTLPLRVLTATLADRVSSLVNTRHISSPNKYDQQVKNI